MNIYLLLIPIALLLGFGLDWLEKRNDSRQGQDVLVSFLVKWWPLVIVALAFLNHSSDIMRGVYAGGILCISLTVVFVHAIVRLARRTDMIRWHLRLTMMLIFILPSLAVSAVSLIHTSALIVTELKATKSFEERVDPFIYGVEKIYESGIWPEWTYRTLHQWLFRGVYKPEVKDTSHRYECYDADFYHLDNVGVTHYRCRGTTYSSGIAMRDFYFLCQAESQEADSLWSLMVWDQNASAACDTTIIPLDIGGTRAKLVRVYGIEDEFDLTRIFCHRNTMSTEPTKSEGFVFDLGSVAHPPDSTRITFVTNMSSSQPIVTRMIPSHTFVDWLLARPKYRAASTQYPMESVHDESIIGSYARAIEYYRSKKDDGESVEPKFDLNVFTATLKNVGAGDRYLIKYSIVGAESIVGADSLAHARK